MKNKFFPENPSGFLTRVSVLDRFQNGMATDIDRDYFAKKYLPLVFKIGRDKKMPEEDICELVSRVFEKIFEIFEKVSRGEREEIIYARKHGKYGKFRSFFSKIIYNTRADMYRERSPAKSKEDASDPFILNATNDNNCAPEEYDDFADAWQKFIGVEALHELKEEMNPTHYDVFFQVQMREKERTQVAEKFHLSVANVYKICSRADEKLRIIIKELEKEHPLEKMADDEMCQYIYQANKEFQALADEFAE